MNLGETMAVKPKRSFDYDLFKKFKLERKNIDGVRHYLTPSGNWYKSVTTIIGEKSDTSWIQEWKDRVGEEEANRITNFAGRRGTNIHDMAERLLLGYDWWKDKGIFDIENFNKLVPVLEDNVSIVYGTEMMLWSDYFKTAGTTDLACMWGDTSAIVDFKTSRRMKKKEDIEGYFVQASVYAAMFYELYQIPINKIVILMLVDHEDELQIFIENPKNYMEQVKETFDVGV